MAHPSHDDFAMPAFTRKEFTRFHETMSNKFESWSSATRDSDQAQMLREMASFHRESEGVLDLAMKARGAPADSDASVLGREKVLAQYRKAEELKARMGVRAARKTKGVIMDHLSVYQKMRENVLLLQDYNIDDWNVMLGGEAGYFSSAHPEYGPGFSALIPTKQMEHISAANGMAHHIMSSGPATHRVLVLQLQSLLAANEDDPMGNLLTLIGRCPLMTQNSNDPAYARVWRPQEGRATEPTPPQDQPTYHKMIRGPLTVLEHLLNTNVYPPFRGVLSSSAPLPVALAALVELASRDYGIKTEAEAAAPSHNLRLGTCAQAMRLLVMISVVSKAAFALVMKALRARRAVIEGPEGAEGRFKAQLAHNSRLVRTLRHSTHGLHNLPGRTEVTAAAAATLLDMLDLQLPGDQCGDEWIDTATMCVCCHHPAPGAASLPHALCECGQVRVCSDKCRAAMGTGLIAEAHIRDCGKVGLYSGRKLKVFKPMRMPGTGLPAPQKAEGEKCAHCGKDATKGCAKCKTVYYCSREHQKAHWKQHKKDCGAASA